MSSKQPAQPRSSPNSHLSNLVEGTKWPLGKSGLGWTVRETVW